MQTVQDNYLMQQDNGLLELCNALQDEDQKKEIKNYIVSFCSHSHNENIMNLCRDLIRNYVICHMGILFEEKYEYKMERWIDHVNDSLIHRLERY